ncbi:fimbrial protein [Erwinia sp. OLTSP20]|nr:fimbrial protein [Erwinia sp. OAMSP11]PIJ70960.1 fimbrial protein [Erwinia sp. OLSSP12]PIJ80326.1 fimbrial protein [Erwinia sp. OLCASP19]PIJ82450.1 fimbrial protein [Erwinia sp. OLMTSP26]PIJ85135.1 fimbrial protein [Erwinia sp. OLMDSP33]PIJ89259.1 fimbrial protein [Erwinia sp. OLTSP20]PIJ95214.1 fimbrial protein [Erwinia sp. OLFS4]
MSALALAIIAGCAQGADWFNPAFLSGNGQEVADLSRFESGAGQAPGVYRVDVWLNDRFITTHSVRFEAEKPPLASEKTSQEKTKANGDNTGLVPCLTLKWLKRLGINSQQVAALQNLHDDDPQCLDFRTLFPGAQSYYDFSTQRLNLSFPQAVIRNSVEGYIPPAEWDEGINAALLNYTLNGDQGTGGKNYFLNLNGGLNLGPWRLRHNASWSYSDYQGHRSNRWQNISTFIQRAVVPLKSELVIGDSNSDGAIFDSLGFRGVRLFTSDPMYPDSQQGYAPTVRGVASGRSKVTIRQNGYVIYQDTVQAGAFEISDLNPTSASGDLDVTVESDAGDVQHYTVPYSTVPLLQREGRIKYELIAGRYRSGAQGKNAPVFLQGTLARGFSGGYTLYGGTQQANRYQSLVAGIGQNLGNWGAVSADLTSAWSRLADNSRHQGQSLRFLYNKSLNSLGTNFQLLGYRYSTRGFYTLDEVAWNAMEGYQYAWKEDDEGYNYAPQSYHNLRRSRKGRFQVNISQQLGKLGSLYLSGSQQTYWNYAGKDQWYQAGFSSDWHGISYNLSYAVSHSTGLAENSRLLSINLSIPLNHFLFPDSSEHGAMDSMYATAQTTRDQDGVTRMQTGVSGSLLKSHNLNYSVMQEHSNRTGNSGTASASLRGGYGQGSAAYSYSRHNHHINWSLSGGIVAHANGLTFSQELGDTNVLIKAPGAKDVRVENANGVKTDWRGYTVLPYAMMYRRNRVALDVNSLDMHTEVDDNVKSVVPTLGALVRVVYGTHTGVRALLTLLHHGRPLPFGAVVTEKPSGASGIVNESGQVYLTGIALSGQLEVVWGQGPAERCNMTYQLPAGSEKKAVAQMTINE